MNQAHRVRDLDAREFKTLMGCTREEFESFCLHADRLQQAMGHPLPVGLYAFWDAIMDAPAEAVRTRADQLTRQPASLSWQPIPKG
jgi:hypothetical protein